MRTENKITYWRTSRLLSSFIPESPLPCIDFSFPVLFADANEPLSFQPGVNKSHCIPVQLASYVHCPLMLVFLPHFMCAKTARPTLYEHLGGSMSFFFGYFPAFQRHIPFPYVYVAFLHSPYFHNCAVIITKGARPRMIRTMMMF